VYEALKHPTLREELGARAISSIDSFVELLDRYETKLHEPLVNQAEVIRELIKEVGFLEDLRRSCKTEDDALKRESNVRDMIASIEEHAGRSTEGIRGFLDEMMLRQENEEDDDEMKGQGVTLITLHAAKGLEFPHVYLIGLEEGVLPHDRSKVEGTVDEERRLLYVGITRAMRTLALTWCRSRLKYGSAMPCTPSSFIKELPVELIDRRDLAEILNAPVSEVSVKQGFAGIFAALNRVTD
jgi:superfamily I DNA/RNA helicase